jgi:PAS domain S-box-containing protein
MDDVAAATLPFLCEGGEMGELMRRQDWSRTPLGLPQEWPQSLKTAVSLMLRARQPVFIGWGPQLVSLYNDGYIPICGSKHPQALAQPMAAVWAEIWSDLAPINEAVLRGQSQWFENRRFDLAGGAHGCPSYFRFSYTPLIADDGAIGGIFCSAIETTSTVQLAERRNREAQRQQRLFEQAPGFICTLSGPEHVFEFVNDAYRRLFNRDEFVGKTVRDVFPELRGQGFYELLDHVYRTGERYVGRDVPARLRGAGGAPDRDVLLDFVYAPVVDDAGRVSGIFCEGHDVTETHAAQQALLDKEEQLRLATDAAEIGLWDLNVPTDTLFWPPRVKAMFGISADTPVSLADFYAGLHPDDRAATSAAFAAACDPAQRALYDVEYRTIGQDDGRIRWIAAKGRAIFEGTRCVRVLGTAIDITARKAAEEAQRDGERRKDEFIATLAHELRNPLAPLRNAVHLLHVQVGTSHRIGALYELMERQLNQLVRLVDDLLELSRISRGTLELRQGVVAVDEVVAAAAEAVEPLLREREHRLLVEPATQPPWVPGDAVRLTQLLSNLLNNAARYTGNGGTIRLQTLVEPDHVVVRVSDNGRGFAADDAQRIFEMFARGDGSSGLGIGLALGRKLAQLHGGTLEAHSAGPGQGATFTVRLPRVSSPDHPARDERAAAPAMHAVRVLIVDDNADAADTLELLLRELGAEVGVARDGSQALAKFEEWTPAVVLLDIGMPGMDGYEVARQLRARHPERPPFIIGLSGWGQERDRQRGRDAGFDHHLVKPADIGALQTLLESIAH